MKGVTSRQERIKKRLKAEKRAGSSNMESRLIVHNFLYNINLIFPIKQSEFQGLNFCLA